MRRRIQFLSLVALIALCGIGGILIAVPSLVPSPTSAAPVAQDANEGPVLAQARSVGIKGCLPTLRDATAGLGQKYAVYTTAAPSTPDAHLAQSVLAITQGDDAQSRALGVLLTAPTASGCDTAAVQVLPLPMSCQAVQAARQKKGPPLSDFNGLYAGDPASGVRQVFVPASASVCVAVSMSVSYGGR